MKSGCTVLWRGFLNPEHQIPNEIQRSKGKNQNDKPESKFLTFTLLFCASISCILHGFGWGLDSGIWNLGDEIATPFARDDMNG